ncbi:MAG: NADH-quinone oxidoreductase subunit C [Syntrophomonas sp.]|nr:NADH-quinone oxidoreductase subunit C [Syntrophomonas sp.]
MDNVAKDKAFDDLRTIMGDRLEISGDSFFSYIKVGPADILPLMQSLREQIGMNYLANLTAVDYTEEFEVVYHLYAIPDNGLKLVVKTRVPRDEAVLPSISAIYPTADWQEREAFDLMGIRFSGHPNLVRVLLPDDFQGHPLRKDFKKEG